MSRRDRLSWLIAVALPLLFVGSPPRAFAQEQFVDSGSASNFRVFPRVGADVRAIKRDSSGRYYILAKPANVVWVYGSQGQLIGQIPNAGSSGAAIVYAEDIDVDSSGNLYVADRGSNAVDIFRADGSLLVRVPVFAPLSVAALPDRQFAVVSLRSKYLVSIYDDDGHLFSQFGDRMELKPGASPQSLMDPGKIYCDAAGHIYFAYTSTPVPTVREYDRVGYMAYTAALPIAEGGSGSSKPEDRLQVGINLGQSNFSEQVGGWASIGSSGTLQFGSSVGTGFGQRMRGGFARSIGGGGPVSGGFGNPFALGQTGNLNGATLFGEGTIQHGVFHFDTGARLGRGRSGHGGGKNSDDSDADASGASLLQFDSLNGVSGGSTSSTSDQDTEILDANFADALASPDGAYDPGPADMAYDPAIMPNLQPGMFSGDMFFRPNRGGFGSGLGGGALGGHGFGGGTHSGEAGFARGASGVGPAGRTPGFGPAGHFVFNTFNVAAVVRVNLDRPAQTIEQKPTLTAVGIDPQTGEAWVAIGSQLIHLAKDGAQLGSYQIATPDGTALYPDAILVEPDRLLLADDPLGIFSFARPDVAQRSNVTAQPPRSQNSP